MTTLSNIISLQGYFNAEIILILGTVLLVLLSFKKHDGYAKLAYQTTLFVLLCALYATCRSPMRTVATFEGLLSFDNFGRFFKILVTLTAMVATVFAEKSKELQRTPKVEFYAFLIALTLGLNVMCMATNLLVVYLAIEMASIVSYIMSGYIAFSKRSEEAALKYVFYGGMASGVMIFGLSLLYGLTGTLNLPEIRQFLMENPTDRVVLFVTFIFVLTGLGYKMAVAPFHMWSPDVYEGAPMAVTAFLSVASKAAGFALTLRFFLVGFVDTRVVGHWVALKAIDWQLLIAVMAAITMTLGNLVAIQQKNIKRFLAYSSVAHAGTMLMGLAVQSLTGIEGILFYFAIYFCMNLGAFLVAILIANQFGTEIMTDYKGLAHRNGFGFFVALCMSVFLLSLAGIPPFAGFIAKWYILGAVVKAGPTLSWLAIVGVLNSVVALFYYIRLVKYMMIDSPSSEVAVALPAKRLTIIMATFAFFSLTLGIFFAPLAHWVQASASLSFLN